MCRFNVALNGPSRSPKPKLIRKTKKERQGIQHLKVGLVLEKWILVRVQKWRRCDCFFIFS